MKSGVLQSFLNIRLVDIGGDDARLEKLQACADDLSKIITEDKPRAIDYILFSMNPRALTEDAIFTEISDNLSNHWATYRSVFADPKPITLFRALALDALAQAQENEPEIAAALFNLAGNTLPFLDLGQEKEIWVKLIDQSNRLLEPLVTSEWPTTEISNEALAPPKTEKPGKVDRKALQIMIEGAVGPSNQNGEALKDPNPQWTNAGQLPRAGRTLRYG